MTKNHREAFRSQNKAVIVFDYFTVGKQATGGKR